MNREQVESGVAEFITRETTMAKIKKAGLPVPPKPKDAVNGTNLFIEWENLRKTYGGVANIPAAELGDFLDRWASMLAYARWVEAIADIDRATAEEIRDTIRKQLYTLQEGTREMKDALVYTEPLYIEWECKYTEALSMYIAAKALREGYEHRLYAVSREITRRGNDMADTRLGITRGIRA